MDRSLWTAFLLLASAAVAGCGQASSATGKPSPQDPVVVYDLPITQVVTDYEEFPGRTDAIYSVEIRARVSGYLDRVYFQDGMPVEKGAQLFQIDPRPFKADFDRATANVIQAEAHAKRLKNEFLRAQNLYDRGVSISREEFDRYAFDHAEADAALGTAKANKDLAALNLEFTRVIAPLSGRLGRRLVDPGNLVKADETSLTTIVTQDPLYVYFDVHEQAMLKIRRLIQEGKVKAKSEKEVAVQINLSDEHGFPHQGIVDFTDNRVDANTGTLRFRAKLSNPNGLITPGLFVRVRLPIGDPHSALLIREQALVTDQGRKKVWVLKPLKNQAGELNIDGNGRVICIPEARDVGTPGVLRDGFREIQDGIKAGDWVVVSGMQKIKVGIKDPQTKEPWRAKAKLFDPNQDSTAPSAEREARRPPLAALAGPADGKDLAGAPGQPSNPSPGATSPGQGGPLASPSPGPDPTNSPTRRPQHSGPRSGASRSRD
jgi:membrane fusion protein, multidrug efflux system